MFSVLMAPFKEILVDEKKNGDLVQNLGFNFG